MENLKLKLSFTLSSGEEINMTFVPGEEKKICGNKYLVSINDDRNPTITIDVSEKCKDTLVRLSCSIVIPMRNYSKVIVPDSGRWFLRYTSIIDFWKSCKRIASDVADIKNPLFIFLNSTGSVETAFGVVAPNVESEFKILEPASNRALNVHTGHIELEISRGTVEYPLNKKTISEQIYIYMANDKENCAWPEVERRFAELQRRRFGLSDDVNEDAFAPIWCSWVDWDSKDINTNMLLENIREGVSLGIRNFIIDDGWYGNGLDSEYDVEMDIGDWEPDKNKIPDMEDLINEAHKLGARLIIWCAPHAVAQKSKAFSKNRNLLLCDSKGIPIMNEPRYYSYCMCCKESRKAVADICVDLLKKWDFDGAKYDLFNWIPSVKCENPFHKHDVSSAVEGLELTLKDINEKTKAIKPSHIVELKQNYGTPFFSEYGSLMRAGDSPFDDSTNFQRTLHIQGYTVKALNDYQSFTRFDTPEDVAVAIIKMISVGIPAYGVNFQKLSSKTKQVINHYNNLYMDNVDIFTIQRHFVVPDNTVISARNKEKCFYFLLSEGKVFELDYIGMVFNGTHSREVVVKNNIGNAKAYVFDGCGNLVYERKLVKGLICVEVPCGGTMKVCAVNE